MKIGHYVKTRQNKYGSQPPRWLPVIPTSFLTVLYQGGLCDQWNIVQCLKTLQLPSWLRLILCLPWNTCSGRSQLPGLEDIKETPWRSHMARN